MSKYDENKQLKCSFCGKPQSQVNRLVAGPGRLYLRRSVFKVCQEILKENYPEEQTTSADEKPMRLPKPRRSPRFSMIMSSNRTTPKALAVAVYNHYKRITKTAIEDDGVRPKTIS